MRNVRASLPLVLLAGCNCGKKPTESFGPVPAPREIVAIVSLRSPDATAASVGALWDRLSPMPMPISTATLREALAGTLSIASEALAEVDLAKPAFAILLDGKRVAGQADDLLAVAVALGDEKKFFAGLGKTRAERKEGAVRCFDPKGGGPLVCAATGRGRGVSPGEGSGRYVILSGLAKGVAAARPFVLGTLAPSAPKSDIEVRVLLDHVFADPGEWEAAAASITDRLGGEARRVLDALRDAREVDVGATVAREGVQLEARVFPKDKGRTKDLVARQRPGAPWGVERLPPRSAVVYADRNDAAALAEWAADIKGWFDRAVVAKEATRAEVGRQVEALAGALEGSVAAAVVHPQAGGGFTAAAVARVASGAKARAALDGLGRKLAETVGGSVQSGAGPVRSVSFSGIFARLAVSVGAGPELAMAWGVSGEVAAVAIGAGAAAEAAALLGAPRKDNAASSPAYGASVVAREGRVGLCYVSPVELARWLASFVPAVDEAVSRALAGAVEARGVVIEWGVDPARTGLTARLDLPADAFLALAPAIRSLSSLALPRGSPPAWMPPPPGGPLKLRPPSLGN